MLVDVFVDSEDDIMVIFLVVNFLLNDIDQRLFINFVVHVICSVEVFNVEEDNVGDSLDDFLREVVRDFKQVEISSGLKIKITRVD